jgi:hypothetical protein
VAVAVAVTGTVGTCVSGAVGTWVSGGVCGRARRTASRATDGGGPWGRCTSQFMSLSLSLSLSLSPSLALSPLCPFAAIVTRGPAVSLALRRWETEGEDSEVSLYTLRNSYSQNVQVGPCVVRYAEESCRVCWSDVEEDRIEMRDGRRNRRVLLVAPPSSSSVVGELSSFVDNENNRTDSRDE